MSATWPPCSPDIEANLAATVRVVNSWPRGRSADGGIDEIPLPVAGRLWLCGKHLVGPDPEAALARVDATAILCFTQRHEIEDRYPGYTTWLTDDERGRWFPTPDLGVRPTAEYLPLVEATVDGLREGDRLIAHCAAGFGRAGTFAAAVLIALGLDQEEAAAVVAESRPMAGPEAGSQRELVAEVAAHFGAASGAD